MMFLRSQIYKLPCILSSITATAVVAVATSNARAEPPHLADYWQPTQLSIAACVQRGLIALQEIGFEDAHPGKSGEVAFGNRGDSHMEVICSIPHWAVFVGASPSLNEIVDYRNQLLRRFFEYQQRRPQHRTHAALPTIPGQFCSADPPELAFVQSG